MHSREEIKARLSLMSEEQKVDYFFDIWSTKIADNVECQLKDEKVAKCKQFMFKSGAFFFAALGATILVGAVTYPDRMALVARANYTKACSKGDKDTCIAGIVEANQEGKYDEAKGYIIVFNACNIKQLPITQGDK